MANRERVVAIGLLTERDLAMLGQGFQRAFRLPDDEPFSDLLFQIDAADADMVQIVGHRHTD